MHIYNEWVLWLATQLQKKRKPNWLKRNKLVKAIKNTSQPKVTASFVILGFLLGSIYAYHGIDAYYHTIRTFVAYEDNFKVHFPGKPTVNKILAQNGVPGQVETSRSYNYSVSKTGADYIVEATKYADLSSSSLSGSSLQSLLGNSINTTA
ncbi:MAG: hypothetical protein WDN66_05200 [Candidatus Saccharibacteria bacterium]